MNGLPLNLERMLASSLFILLISASLLLPENRREVFVHVTLRHSDGFAYSSLTSAFPPLWSLPVCHLRSPLAQHLEMTDTISLVDSKPEDNHNTFNTLDIIPPFPLEKPLCYLDLGLIGASRSPAAIR